MDIATSNVMYARIRKLEYDLIAKETELSVARCRINALTWALRFYAGRLREDRNGYEFGEEPGSERMRRDGA
jgi:hypothetical protein